MRAVLLVVAFSVLACGPDGSSKKIGVPGRGDAQKSTAVVRAERRAYDGAPPVIPHPRQGATCTQCHNETGMAVEGLGFAPPTPHEDTAREAAMSLCTQCHVFKNAETVFDDSTFASMKQDLRKGDRLYQGAPPVIPHQTLLRENCAACHTGPAAREEVRCSHPERARCVQCHVEARSSTVFAR